MCLICERGLQAVSWISCCYCPGLAADIELRFYSRDTLYDHHAVRAGTKRDGLFLKSGSAISVEC